MQLLHERSCTMLTRCPQQYADCSVLHQLQFFDYLQGSPMYSPIIQHQCDHSTSHHNQVPLIKGRVAVGAPALTDKRLPWPQLPPEHQAADSGPRGCLSCKPMGWGWVQHLPTFAWDQDQIRSHQQDVCFVGVKQNFTHPHSILYALPGTG